ncbi:MAG: VanZ family protein [Bacteroidota bacterium]
MIKRLTILYILLLLLILVLVDTGNHKQIYWLVKKIPFGDKIGHFLLMGTLSFFVNMALNLRSFHLWGRDILLGTSLLFLIFTLEELSQGFLPHRTLSVQDWIANTLGIVLAGMLAKRLYPRFTRSSSSYTPDN